MSKKNIKLTTAILKRIIREEKKKLYEQAKKVKIASETASKTELISEIKKLVNLRRKQRYLTQRLRNVSEERKNITKKLRKGRS